MMKPAITARGLSKRYGGMKRRLIIARALINRPRILICDEPTTGLDPQARHLVWQKLRQLKARGVTLVLTTHYMEEAAQLCDRLAIMDQGRILDIGSPKALIEKHVLSEVFEFELADGARTQLRERLQGLPAVDLQRALALGEPSWDLLGDVAWMAALALIAVNAALALMRRRLIT